MKRRRKRLTFDHFFDIECIGWDQYATGAIGDRDGNVTIVDDPDEMLFELLDLKGNVWAHWGGIYDFLWVTDMLDKRGIKYDAILSGNILSCVKIKGGPTLRDSGRLVPLKLADAAKIGGTVKYELDLPCICGSDCGGYCSISTANLPRVKEYLHQDVIALQKCLTTIEEWAQDSDFHLKATVGSSAYGDAADLLGERLQLEAWSPRIYTRVKAGYYGGRTEVYMTEADRGRQLDIRSAYVASLRDCHVPIGPVSYYDRMAEVDREWQAGHEGIYAARVFIDHNCWLPPLPMRHPDALGWHVGEIEGAWTRPELLYALDNGASIICWRWCATYLETERLFTEWCDRVDKMRASAGRDSPLGGWIKYIGNSLTGKLGEQPDKIGYMGNQRPICKCKSDPCWCSIMLDPHGRIWGSKYWRMPANNHVQMVAYLTTGTRIKFHQQMLAAGYDRAVYGDTDSCFRTGDLAGAFDVGPDLGQFDDKGEWRRWRCPAPKVYAYETIDGKDKWAAKGVDIETIDEWERFAAGQPMLRTSGVLGFRSAARMGRGLFLRKQNADGSPQSRSLHKRMLAGSRLKVGTRTVPITAERYLSLRNDE